MKSILKNIKPIWWIYSFYLGSLDFIKLSFYSFFKEYLRFIGDYLSYKKSNTNPNFILSSGKWIPCLTDRTVNTPVDPIYFYQDAWGCSVLFKNKPATHIDIGSAAKTVAIMAKYVPVTMVDIRPLQLELEGLSFIEGTILNLPFKDNSIESLSSLCVVEHIGLGRYGDPIDSWGSEKAIREMQRVMKPGGSIIFSVPVDTQNTIYFNGHRAFIPEYILKCFDQSTLVEDKYIYKNSLFDHYQPESGYGVGLFWFKKN